jgi:hypothetical protein
LVSLYRKGRISADALDHQLTQVDQEEAAIRAATDDLLGRAAAVESATLRLHSAEALLDRLGNQLDQVLTYDLKRSLIETLVERITVYTVDRDGKRQSSVDVVYRFTPIASRRGTDCARQ